MIIKHGTKKTIKSVEFIGCVIEQNVNVKEAYTSLRISVNDIIPEDMIDLSKGVMKIKIKLEKV